MKIKLLVLAMFVVFLQLPAQDTLSAIYPSDIQATAIDKLIGRDSNSYYGMKVLTDELTIYRLDTTFKVIGKNTFSHLVLEDGIYEIYQCYMLDGKLMLFYFRQSKKIRTLVAAEVNVQTMQLKGTHEILVRYTAPSAVYAENERSPNYTDYYFTVCPSVTGNYFSVSYVFNNKTYFLLFTNSLEKKWEVTYDMYFLGFYRDLRVTDDGRVFLLHKSNVAWPENWMLVEMNNGKLMGYPLDNENYDFFRGAIGFTPSGNVFVTGYYSFYEDKYTVIRNVGIFFFAPWLNNGNVKFTAFTPGLLSMYRTPFERKQISKDYSKYGYAGADGLYYLQVHSDSAGNIFMIGEEVYDKSLHLSPTFRLATANSVFTFSTETNERLVYASLLVSILDTSGNVRQHTWILKKQNDIGCASYVAKCSDGAVTVFYNDNIRNVGHEKDTGAIATLNSVDRSVVVERTVTTSGEIKYGLPFGSTEPYQIEINGVLSENNALTFFVSKRKALFFGTK